MIRHNEKPRRVRNLNVTGEKQRTAYKGKLIRITADFSTRTIKDRKDSSEGLQVLKENFKSRLVYPT